MEKNSGRNKSWTEGANIGGMEGGKTGGMEGSSDLAKTFW